MKKIILFLSTFFLISKIFSQSNDNTLPKIKDDTLYTTSGYKIAKKQDIKIGTGSMPDGDFKFIRTNSISLFAYQSNNGYNGLANQANSFPRNQSGLNYKIKTITNGKRKAWLRLLCKVGSGLVNYEIDVENAITSGEMAVPDEYKQKPKQATTVVEVKQPISVADKLIKLKKLYADSVLT